MWKLLLCAALWIGLTFSLNRSWKLGETSLPPVGKFFSPGYGFWRNAEPHSPRSHRQQIIILEGVQNEVRITYDDRMVPHIFAQNDLDAYYAQGFITARHRLWQMDISTRAAAGELSKILGPRTLNHDKGQRRMGIGFAAENAVKGWEKNPEDMTLLHAYASGVNAYINSLHPSAYPVEYKLLDYSPEPWTPLRSAYFVESMATRLCLEEDDLENTLLLKWLGKERFDALFPEYNPVEDPVIPPGTSWDFEPLITSLHDTSMTAYPLQDGKAALQSDYHEGSNNWAVAGSRTKSGRPILCNDPHLGLSLPAIWYEIQIVTPEQNVYGVSLPAVPGVIIGFNEHLAWGVTNTGLDVLDWYTIQWTDDTQTEYYLDGKRIPVEYRMEKIAIRGSETLIDTVRYTVWGPVQKDGPHEGLAMRWLAHDVPDSHEPVVFKLINHATSHEEFVAALSEYQTPAQNFVYADKQGNIALHIGGKMPLRHTRNGRFVQDGSLSTHGWHGSIPPVQNPGILNPIRGFVASANQQTTDSTYPYIYHGGFEDFRGRILNRYLSGMEQCTPQDMKALQCNTVSLKAEELLPELLSVVQGNEDGEKAILDQLKGWNYTYHPATREPVIFELWYDAFNEMLWDDFLRKTDSMYISLPEGWRINLLVRNDQASREFDIDTTAEHESFQDIAQRSFSKAIQQYAVLDETKQTWGSYRQTTIRHLARIPAFDRILSSVPGHADALNATTSTHGPSWRMIVHLTDPVEAYVVYPGGQSGNPGSPYYDMMVDAWEKGEYYTAQFLTSPDELQPTLVISLKPVEK